MKKTFSQKQITQQATGSEEEIFYQLDEKNLPEMMLLIISFFSISPVRVSGGVIIKDNKT